MSDAIKSGKEVVEEFFNEINKIDGVDAKLVNKLINLHNGRKFTDTNIQNALDELLQEEINEVSKKNGDN